MLPYTYRFLFSLLGTFIIETGVLILLVRKAFGINDRHLTLKVIVCAGIFANLSTIAYVWYVIPILTFWNLSSAIAIGEVFALAMEAAFYAIFLKFSMKRALFVSFLCNLSSFVFVLPILRALHLLS